MLPPFLPKQARLLALLLALVLALAPAARAADAGSKVYVILWLDTEDYILPASDDAALHLAEFLTREGIRATFKVVGEKARTLERRKRTDVIAALKKHEIGYHSNWHSVQPSPAMYCADLGWDDGVAEFDRRERPGFEDVKRIFGATPVCYGQPGSSWAPQSYGAMRRWGMRIYLDAGSHVNLDDRPCYYGGALNLYKLAYTLRTKLGGEKDLREAEDQFAAARQKLLAEHGGVVSIYYHPCEFVHKEFWDGANFLHGANPPREQWKLPAAKTPEESRVAYATFEAYVRFIKRFPDVRFVVATEGAKLYRDKARGRSFSPAELRAVAAAVTDQVRFQRRGDYALAPSEVFALLNEYVTGRGAGREPEAVVLKGTPFGPSHALPALPFSGEVSRSQFLRTAADVADVLRKQDRVPTAVWLGGVRVPPETYLLALARVATDPIDGKPVPESIPLQPARLDTTAVAGDAPSLWRWVIFPPGFRAPALMELAKRQAWTVKPAVLDHRGELP
jgi:hypothetical protein